LALDEFFNPEPSLPLPHLWEGTSLRPNDLGSFFAIDRIKALGDLLGNEVMEGFDPAWRNGLRDTALAALDAEAEQPSAWYALAALNRDNPIPADIASRIATRMANLDFVSVATRDREGGQALQAIG